MNNGQLPTGEQLRILQEEGDRIERMQRSANLASQLHDCVASMNNMLNLALHRDHTTAEERWSDEDE